MERLIVIVAVAAVAVAVAALVRRRIDPATEPAPTGYNVPAQVHRADFARPDAEWLVAVFTSATCQTCAGMWDKARHLDSEFVAVAEVEFTAERSMHERYGIDGVPTIVVADQHGIVRKSFLGPATATDLWAALAELREPGSVPDACHDHVAPLEAD